jgi:hypothetical protein
MKEISEEVFEKLAEAVELWADENLGGKPALLAQVMFFSMEQAMKSKHEEIFKTFAGEEQ